MVLRIVDWDCHFENNRTRELKSLAWVPFPNCHDGDGYTELLDHQDGAAHYGAWCVIVQVASKCDPRGTLLRDGFRAHDSASLSRMTRIPASIFDAAIDRLLSIQWLESLDVDPKELATIPQAGAEEAIPSPQGDAEKRPRTEGNGMEWKEGKEQKEKARSCGYTQAFESWYGIYPRKTQKEAASAAFGRAMKRILDSDKHPSSASALDWLCSVTRLFADSPKGKGDYVPYPATWLNQGRYDDDPDEWKRGGSTNDKRPKTRGVYRPESR